MENKTCISKNIAENITKVQTIFEGCNDLVEHEFKLNRNKNGEFSEEKSIYVVYIDGLCNNEMDRKYNYKTCDMGVEGECEL